MLALEKWGQGRYKPLVKFAHAVASGADAACELCQAVRESKLRNHFAKVEDKQAWLDNYKGQVFLVVDPKFGNEFFSVFAGEEFGEWIEKLLEEIKEFLVGTPEDRKRIVAKLVAEVRRQKPACSDTVELACEIDRMLDPLVQIHNKTFHEVETETEVEAGLMLLKRSIRARFFFLVVLPCWMEFRTSPTKLYEEALAGDFDALCKLLNLDQLCLSDERILGQFQCHMESNEVRRGILLKSMELEPLKKLKKKALKVSLAAFVYAVFNRVHQFTTEFNEKLRESGRNAAIPYNHGLTYPKLKGLYDALHQDATGETIGDPDFSQITPEGFKISVKRELPFWKKKLGISP